MGMASHTFFSAICARVQTVCARIDTLYLWLRQAALAEGSAADSAPLYTPSRPPRPDNHQRHGHLPGPQPLRPNRTSWPFTVRPTDSHEGSRHTASTKVLREPVSGRLVIAGRMADVCAELDRLAATEALQA